MIGIENLWLTSKISENIFKSSSSKSSEKNYSDILKKELISTNEQSFEEMFESIFESHFNQPAGKFFYHVFDATSIPRNIWTHNDFPYSKFLSETIDESVLNWQPSRKNPSQLDSKVQTKIQATLGRHAIIIPPELDEKMQSDSKIRQKVIDKINQLYKFHVPNPSNFLPAMPGTKFYGEKIYGSVIIFDKDGEVSNCEVSSGGGFIGPDEKTLQQIEHEKRKKLERKEFNQMLMEQAQTRHFDMLQLQLENIL